MIKLAESINYIITSEYETVNLEIKNRNQTIIIGDFYGDPCVALISEDETFCLVGGEGIIIYYLQDPFSEYQRNVSSKQWKEWGRDENTICHGTGKKMCPHKIQYRIWCGGDNPACPPGIMYRL